MKWLTAFKRINIKKGKTIADSLKLCINNLSVYDTSIHDFILEPGRFELQLAASSADVRIIDTIKIKSKPDTGIRQTADDYFIIWPNPAEDEVFIKAKAQLNITGDDYEISLFNLQGKRIDCKVKKTAGQGEYSLVTAGLPQGTYFLDIDNGINNFTYRIVINR